jgi:hypothetical protein
VITTSASSKPARSQRPGIFVVEQALGHERLGNRDPGRVDESAQCTRSVRADRAAPCQRDRALGVGDDLRRLLELAGPGLGLYRVAPGEGRGVERLRHHVLGELQVGAAGLLRLGYLEGLADDLRDDLGTTDPGIPLNDRPHDAD